MQDYALAEAFLIGFQCANMLTAEKSFVNPIYKQEKFKSNGGGAAGI
jgi:hypothetical protein